MVFSFPYLTFIDYGIYDILQSVHWRRSDSSLNYDTIYFIK